MNSPIESAFDLSREPAITARNSDTLISVCVIVPDRAELLEPFISNAVSVLESFVTYYEILLIDNSTPVEVHTAIGQLQKRIPHLRMLRLSRRYDAELAIAAALDHCVGDYVVVMDSVFYPPELIPNLVKRAISGFDAVVAEPTGASSGVIDRALIQPLYRTASRVLGFSLKPDESYFRVFSRRLVNSLIRIRSKNRSLSSMNGLIGLRCQIVPYVPHSGLPEIPVPQRVRRQLTTLAHVVVSNSGIPLRFAALLGLLASGLNLLYLFYILAVTLVKSRIAEGWLTSSLMHTTMFLLLFVIMSILSEYVARILDESKEQPLYFVESESNSTVASATLERLNVV